MTDTAYLCHACTGRLRSTLRSCLHLTYELETTVARLGRHGDPVGSRSAEKPLPVNLHASMCAADLTSVVHGWARCLWEESGSPEEHAPTEPVSEWLADHMPSVRLREWASEAYSEIEAAVSAGWREVDIPPETQCLGHCTCGEPLRVAAGQATVRCPDPECGARYDVAERRERMLAASDGMELPAGTIARALTDGPAQVTPAMIRGWAHWDAAHGGWFVACAVDRSGRPRYRLGDARRRLAQARAASIAVSVAS
jgi:hypothetical protein